MKEYDSEKKDLYWQIAGLELELKKYKDIEDELGIDLITLFNALKNGIYTKTKNGISFKRSNDLRIRPHTNQWQLYYFSYSRVFTKDYGKTWALTKEELL